MTDFGVIETPLEIIHICERLPSSKDERPGRINKALNDYFKVFKDTSMMSNIKRNFLFLLLRSKDKQDIDILKQCSQQYRSYKINVFILGFGNNIDMKELQQIARDKDIFQINSYQDITGGGQSLSSNIYAESGSVFPRIQRRLSEL